MASPWCVYVCVQTLLPKQSRSVPMRRLATQGAHGGPSAPVDLLGRAANADLGLTRDRRVPGPQDDGQKGVRKRRLYPPNIILFEEQGRQHVVILIVCSSLCSSCNSSAS